MKKLLFAFVLSLSVLLSFAQTPDTVKVYRIGIFASLYLDSSFTGSSYKFTNQMPKHILPGLDFVQGALMAVDSLHTDKKVEVTVYDLRSAEQSLFNLTSQNKFDSLDLIIAAVSGNEYRQMADIALQKNIPFVSATYPNDGGVTNNPFTIIVNSTLPVHCEAIYNFVMRNNPTANILYVRKKGIQEDRLAGYFNGFNKSTNGGQLLKWKNVLLTDSFTVADLRTSLDSEKVNLIICGSLDESFGLRLATTANGLRKTYPFQIAGMPTWEGIKDLSKPEFNEVIIYHSSTFFNTGTVKWGYFTKTFTESTNGRPSDLAYKGYELSWHFINLLLKYDDNLMQNLNDRSFRIFTEYDFKPIRNSTSGKPDYFENKRIYILKRSSGLISRMN
ncbi:MAG: hypothetical protein IPK31_01255 [Chitinophagaceae bacterium]|nr:hypothetical protein [Chitinophagaceae bacterium]